MSIDFKCLVCKDEIRVPEGTEGQETKCPKCQTVQPIPGLVESESEAVGDPSTASQERMDAMEKLRTPTMIASFLVMLAILISLAYLAYVFCQMAGFFGPPDIAAAVVQLISVVGSLVIQFITLAGLRSAINLNSYSWAWIGFILGMLPCTSGCLAIPFCGFGMVLLADASIQRQFDS